MRRRSLEARIAELHQRRALLAERAEAQRLELSAVCLEFERPLRWVRAAVGVMAYLRNSPVFASISTAVSILIGGRLAHLRHWLSRGLMVYRLGTAIKDKWHEHQARKSNEVEAAT